MNEIRLIIILSIVFLCFFHKINSAQSDYLNRWHQTQLPINDKVNHLQPFENNFVASVQNKLIISSADGWILFDDQPPVDNIDLLRVVNDEIWITEYLLSYTNNLYVYKSGKWEKLTFPGINHFNCWDFVDSKNFVMGGDRELLRYESGNWDRVENIPDPVGASQILLNDKNEILVLTYLLELFLYQNNSWEEIVLDVKPIEIIKYQNKFYLLTKNDLLKYEKGKFVSTHLSSAEDYKIVICEKNIITLITENGQTYQYDQTLKLTNKFKIDDRIVQFSFNNSKGCFISSEGNSFQNYGVPVAQKSSLHFTNQIPIFKSRKLNDEYGVIIRDINNDGVEEIYSLCIYDPNRLYLNSEIEYLSEEAEKRGMHGVGSDEITNTANMHMGAALNDIDNDGDPDLYLANILGKNNLLLNNGDGYFRSFEQYNNEALGNNERTNSVLLSDIDNDGDLDLFLINEFTSNRLYKNNGYGYFEEITKLSGLETSYGGMSGTFADIDNDGDQDLCVMNWAKQNKIYLNESHNEIILFKDITNTSGLINNQFSKSNGCSFADIDNDGDLDLFVTNRKTSNEFYINNGDGNFQLNTTIIETDSALTYGSTFSDFDNDGWTDLYITNVGQNTLYKNFEGEKFVDVSLTSGVIHKGYGTGTATGDFDNDGDLDIYSSVYIQENSKIFYNQLNKNNFLKIDLEGVVSNRDAIGAKVYFYKDENLKNLIGFREILSSTGYLSSNSKTIHFGTGGHDSISAKIVFPTSGLEIIKKNIITGSSLKINEYGGINKAKHRLVHNLFALIYDYEIFIELCKALFLMIVIILSFVLSRKVLMWQRNSNLLIHFSALVVYIISNSIFLHSQFFLAMLLPFVLSIGGLVIVHLLYQKSLFNNKLETKLNETRDTIARDLHDDLASTISSAVNFTDVLLKQSDNKSSFMIKKIYDLLLNSSNSVNDIIWMASNKNDLLLNLISKIKSLIDDATLMLNAKSQICIDEIDINTKVSNEFKRNLYLMCKEICNNIVKHSSASTISLSIKIYELIMEIEIKDDGVGITESDNTQLSNQGRGLSNIKKRAELIDAELIITSDKTFGTKLIIKSKLT